MAYALLFSGQANQHAGMLPWLESAPASAPVLRHMEAHAIFPSGLIVRSGFSCQVIVSAVNAALEAIVALEDSKVSKFSLQSGVLSAEQSKV
jgi:hypothetical protein